MDEREKHKTNFHYTPDVKVSSDSREHEKTSVRESFPIWDESDGDNNQKTNWGVDSDTLERLLVEFQRESRYFFESAKRRQYPLGRLKAHVGKLTTPLKERIKRLYMAICEDRLAVIIKALLYHEKHISIDDVISRFVFLDEMPRRAKIQAAQSAASKLFQEEGVRITLQNPSRF